MCDLLAPGLVRNVLRLVVGDGLVPVTALRVLPADRQVTLVERRPNGGDLEQVLDLLFVEVGEADGAREVHGDRLLHAFPQRLVLGVRGCRVVNEHLCNQDRHPVISWVLPMIVLVEFTEFSPKTRRHCACGAVLQGVCETTAVLVGDGAVLPCSKAEGSWGRVVFGWLTRSRRPMPSSFTSSCTIWSAYAACDRRSSIVAARCQHSTSTVSARCQHGVLWQSEARASTPSHHMLHHTLHHTLHRPVRGAPSTMLWSTRVNTASCERQSLPARVSTSASFKHVLVRVPLLSAWRTACHPYISS